MYVQLILSQDDLDPYYDDNEAVCNCYNTGFSSIYMIHPESPCYNYFIAQG